MQRYFSYICAGRLRSGSQRHRHFVGFFNVPARATSRGQPCCDYSEKQTHFSRLLRRAWRYEGPIFFLNPQGHHGGRWKGTNWRLQREIQCLLCLHLSRRWLVLGCRSPVLCNLEFLSPTTSFRLLSFSLHGCCGEWEGWARKPC